jgi:hypothetical protein
MASTMMSAFVQALAKKAGVYTEASSFAAVRRERDTLLGIIAQTGGTEEMITRVGGLAAVLRGVKK